MTRRRALAVARIAAALPLVLAVVIGALYARGRVDAARRDLLRAETGNASELARTAAGTATLDAAFGSRWTVDPDTVGAEEVALVDANGGLAGRGAVYDEDSWFRTGTVRLLDRSGREPSFGAGLWALTLLGALAAVGAVWYGVGPQRPRRLGWPAAAAALALALSLTGLHRWAGRALERLTTERVETGVAILSEPDAAARAAAEAGGVYRLTGLSFLLRGPSGEVQFSSLPTAATEDLATAAPGRTRADRIPYEVRDVGSVRLVALPYSHTHAVGGVLAALVLVSVAMSGAATAFSRLLDAPRALRRHLTAWAFLTPSGALLAIFTLGPLVAAAWLSLHRWSIIDAARPFVGLTNYVDIATDATWWNAIRNTALFTLHVPVSMAIALGIALLVYRRARGIVALRALFFLPTVTSLVAISIVWTWMFHTEFGLFNWLLSLVGVGPVAWLTSTRTALIAIMMMSIWMVVGYQMVLFLAGLAAIPSEQYDAARIDGAGPWRRFIHVTLPGLRHTLFFVLITSVIGSFQVFGAVYVMTEGGPLRATDVAVFHIYLEAWEFLRFGNAAAMSWMLFGIVFLVTWLQFRVLERRVEAS